MTDLSYPGIDQPVFPGLAGQVGDDIRGFIQGDQDMPVIIRLQQQLFKVDLLAFNMLEIGLWRNQGNPVIDLDYPVPPDIELNGVISDYPHVVQNDRQDNKEGHGDAFTAAAPSGEQPHIRVLVQPEAVALNGLRPGDLLQPALVIEDVFIQDRQGFFHLLFFQRIDSFGSQLN